MTDRTIPYSSLWHIYTTTEQHKAQILHWFNLPKHLPLYSEDMQIEILTGAPIEILKQHQHLLKPRAKRKLLGIEEKKKSSYYSSAFGAFG